MHFLSYRTAFERLLIFRRGQLMGDCWAQSLLRDAWFMYTRRWEALVLYLFSICSAWACPSDKQTHPSRAWFYFFLSTAAAVRLLSTVTSAQWGGLFCWQAPLRSTGTGERRLFLWRGTAEVRLCAVISDKGLVLGAGGFEKHFFANRPLSMQLARTAACDFNFRKHCEKLLHLQL